MWWNIDRIVNMNYVQVDTLIKNKQWVDLVTLFVNEDTIPLNDREIGTLAKLVEVVFNAGELNGVKAVSEAHEAIDTIPDNVILGIFSP